MNSLEPTPGTEAAASSNTKSSPATLPAADWPHRNTMAKGVQTTFSTASKLANFLPTGSGFIFSAVLPTIYKGGQCSSLSTTMMAAFLGLCTAICFFTQFTDSFQGPDGKLVYGFVLKTGLKVFQPHPSVQIPKDKKYKLELADFVHAMLSVVVFLAMAFSDQRVIDCLFPEHSDVVHEVMDTLVLIVGFVCSSLFLLFPITRRGFIPA